MTDTSRVLADLLNWLDQRDINVGPVCQTAVTELRNNIRSHVWMLYDGSVAAGFPIQGALETSATPPVILVIKSNDVVSASAALAELLPNIVIPKGGILLIPETLANQADPSR